jgi:prepilin-type N-terminal cleavage/methylation domain-containing protein
MITKLKNYRGFTLLELMIAMSVLAVALMGILPFFFYAQAQIKQATITNIALSLIQQKMERIGQLDYELIHHMDAPFHPDMTTQYSYILPERNLPPCSTMTPNPCGFQEWCNCLVDIVEAHGYYFTRLINIDDPRNYSSLEFPDVLQPGSPTGLYLPNLDTKGVTIEVRWNTPRGEQFVRSRTMIYDNTEFVM